MANSDALKARAKIDRRALCNQENADFVLLFILADESYREFVLIE